MEVALKNPTMIKLFIESWLQNLTTLEQDNVLAQYNLSPRSLALLLLQKDPDIWSTLKQNSKQQQEIEILLTVTQNQLKYPVDLAIAVPCAAQWGVILGLCVNLSLNILGVSL